VRRFCRQCDNCNRYVRGKLPRLGPLQPMLTGAPLERLHFDVTGPHPRSRRGSVYIVTCIDPFTKWAEAFPVQICRGFSGAKYIEVATVTRVLVEQVMCRFGTQIAGISDRGR